MIFNQKQRKILNLMIEAPIEALNYLNKNSNIFNPLDEQKTRDGWTLMHYAYNSLNPELIEYCINKKFSINIESKEKLLSFVFNRVKNYKKLNYLLKDLYLRTNTINNFENTEIINYLYKEIPREDFIEVISNKESILTSHLNKVINSIIVNDDVDTLMKIQKKFNIDFNHFNVNYNDNYSIIEGKLVYNYSNILINSINEHAHLIFDYLVDSNINLNGSIEYTEINDKKIAYKNPVSECIISNNEIAINKLYLIDKNIFSNYDYINNTYPLNLNFRYYNRIIINLFFNNTIIDDTFKNNNHINVDKNNAVYTLLNTNQIDIETKYSFLQKMSQSKNCYINDNVWDSFFTHFYAENLTINNTPVWDKLLKLLLHINNNNSISSEYIYKEKFYLSDSHSNLILNNNLNLKLNNEDINFYSAIDYFILKFYEKSHKYYNCDEINNITKTLIKIKEQKFNTQLKAHYNEYSLLSKGYNTFHIACNCFYTNIFNIFNKEELQKLNYPNKIGNYPINELNNNFFKCNTLYDKNEQINFLKKLQSYDINIYQKNASGYDIFFESVHYDKLEIIKYLVDNNKDIINELYQDKSIWYKINDEQILKFLIQNGLTLHDDNSFHNIVNEVLCDKLKINDLRNKEQNKLNNLICFNPDFTYTSLDNNNLLIELVKKEKYHLANTLISKKPEQIMHINNQNKTALHYFLPIGLSLVINNYLKDIPDKQQDSCVILFIQLITNSDINKKNKNGLSVKNLIQKKNQTLYNNLPEELKILFEKKSLTDTINQIRLNHNNKSVNKIKI